MMEPGALQPRQVEPVQTAYRRIVTPIPVPESIPILEAMYRVEARGMGGQPPILWDRAEGYQVYDRFGNQWIDWTSGVVATNAGHAHPKVRRAIIEQVEHGLLHHFLFPAEPRARLATKLVDLAPPGLDKVFLFTTGSEAVECAVKFARARAHRVGGPDKNVVVSFENAFHGRTLGSLQAGGIPAQKEWIVHRDPDFVQVPFPDGFRCPVTDFDLFLESLDQQGIAPSRVAAVLSETYQGGNASFAPPEYFQAVRRFCDEHEAALIFDEVQAGFGRTGKFWSFEHYGVNPDLITCGKGIACGMPLSAVVGPAATMDVMPPGLMTVTHSGNPICSVAALANIEAILEEHLTERAAKLGEEILMPGLQEIASRFGQYVGAVHGRGLVAALHLVEPGGVEPNAALAQATVRRCVEKGLMLFAPVGFGGSSVKVCPPLMIEEEPLRESIAVCAEALEEAIDEVG